MIHHGDLFDVLPTLAAESIDACVTDPPYELGFMGKHWDGSGVAFNPETWRAVARVLKPGAHLVAFGGTRTFHRIAVAIEDAGFEIRDCLSWLYGSGFPKSLNLPGGRGTALKPSWEPCVLARKPVRGTVAANVERYGTAALNVDACRIAISPEDAEAMSRCNTPGSGRFGSGTRGFIYGGGNGTTPPNTTLDTTQGRWPANVLLNEEAAAMLDEMTGELKSGALLPGHKQGSGSFGHVGGDFITGSYGGDSGGASRFYYVAKPSREERDMGCHGPGWARNTHPTVKPVELMRWLVRLVTPPDGVVLDPFAGSGTTGMACRYELRKFIGIEREAEYVEIAKRRIAAVAPLFGDEVFV